MVYPFQKAAPEDAAGGFFEGIIVRFGDTFAGNHQNHSMPQRMGHGEKTVQPDFRFMLAHPMQIQRRINRDFPPSGASSLSWVTGVMDTSVRTFGRRLWGRR